MSAKDYILVEAMKLPEAERLEVAEQLYESVLEHVDDDAEQAWATEIERRIKEIDAGQSKFVHWEEGRRMIRGEGDGPSAA